MKCLYRFGAWFGQEWLYACITYQEYVYKSLHYFCADLQVRACTAESVILEIALQDVAIYGHLGYGEISKVCKIVLLLVLDLHALCVRLY